MKQNTYEKSFTNYSYRQPIPLKDPAWNTGRDAINWSPGNYSYEKLPSGVYNLETPWNAPPYLRRIQFATDSLLALPDDPSTEVLRHIVEFWDKRDAFADLGITYKRGIILYGPPGSGKSVTIYRLASMLQRYDAVMLPCRNAQDAATAIEIVKLLEPTRKIVVVLEDIDGMINRSGDEDLTYLLDGGTDVSNVLFIATTNYPERIPARVLNRPSRFDVRIEIGMPSEAARRAYIQHIVGKNLLVDIDELVSNTDGMSIAQIKEVIILTQIFENNISTAVEKVRGVLRFSNTKEKEAQ